MDKKNQKLFLASKQRIDEKNLFNRVSEIIENRKSTGIYANRKITLMYWEIKQYTAKRKKILIRAEGFNTPLLAAGFVHYHYESKDNDAEKDNGT